MTSNIRKIIKNKDTQLLELSLSLITLVVGLSTLNPFTASVQAGTAAAAAMSELMWGLVLTGFGGIQFLGLAKNSLRLRKIGAMFTTFLWSFILVVTHTAGITNIAIFIPITLSHYFIFSRVLNEREDTRTNIRN